MFPFDPESLLTAESGSDEQQFLGDSACVRSAKFVKNVLTIEFGDESMYEYYGVHPFVWANLQRSTSKGEFFNRRIRNAGYSFSRLR
jgi:KTSC domain-containing protein